MIRLTGVLILLAAVLTVAQNKELKRGAKFSYRAQEESKV